MSFDASSLTALVSAGSFSIWDYRTGDSRAAVLASGYFAAATDRLLPGHVVILHSADGMSFLPMREAGAVGNGLVLDSVSAPLRLSRTAAGRFGIERCIRRAGIPDRRHRHYVGFAVATGRFGIHG